MPSRAALVLLFASEAVGFGGRRGPWSVQAGGRDWQILHNEFRGSGLVSSIKLGMADGGKGGIRRSGERHLVVGNTFDDTGEAIRVEGMSYSVIVRNLIPQAVCGHAVWQRR